MLLEGLPSPKLQFQLVIGSPESETELSEKAIGVFRHTAGGVPIVPTGER